MAQELLVLTIGDYMREGKPIPAVSRRRGAQYRRIELPALKSATPLEAGTAPVILR